MIQVSDANFLSAEGTVAHVLECSVMGALSSHKCTVPLFVAPRLTDPSHCSSVGLISSIVCIVSICELQTGVMFSGSHVTIFSHEISVCV